MFRYTKISENVYDYGTFDLDLNANQAVGRDGRRVRFGVHRDGAIIAYYDGTILKDCSIIIKNPKELNAFLHHYFAR